MSPKLKVCVFKEHRRSPIQAGLKGVWAPQSTEQDSKEGIQQRVQRVGSEESPTGSRNFLIAQIGSMSTEVSTSRTLFGQAANYCARSKRTEGRGRLLLSLHPPPIAPPVPSSDRAQCEMFIVPSPSIKRKTLLGLKLHGLETDRQTVVHGHSLPL